MAVTVRPAQKGHTSQIDHLDLCRHTPFTIYPDHPEDILSKLLAPLPSPTFSHKRSRALSSSDIMAATSRRSRTRKQGLCLQDLASEILTLIFKHVREKSLRDIVSIRLVCRWFDELATPIEYQNLILTKRLLYPSQPYHFAIAYEHIRLYTNHVFASVEEIEGCHDHHRAAARITNSILKLSSLTWRYANVHSHACTCPLASILLRQPGSDRLRHDTRVHFENVPPRHLELNRNLYLAAIPTDLLVSLKMAEPSPPLMTGLEGLKQVLLRSRSLEVFHYQDKGQGTSFSFRPGERLPAFKDLCLEGYDWSHAADEVRRHWDLSRIRSLQLINMPVLKALRSFDPADLQELDKLVARDSGFGGPDMRTELSLHLDWLVRSCVSALSWLELTVDMRRFVSDALMRHAWTLQTLSLRDFVGFDDESRRCPTMWTGHLAGLAASLVNLEALELDMDAKMTDTALFVKTLCNFPRLHTLTLHTQTVVGAWEDIPQGVDKDADAAMEISSGLLRGRAAAMAAAAAARGERSCSQPCWHCVTLNVGGWRPVMVRRLSPGWRSKNDAGLFAERCFVMQLPRWNSGDLAEPYIVTEIPAEEPDVEEQMRFEMFRRSPIVAYLHGAGITACVDDSEQTIIHNFTEVVMNYMSGGVPPKGNWFGHPGF